MMRCVALILAGLSLLLAGPALAHSRLANSSPSNGATVTEAPEALTLGFRNPVNLTSVNLSRQGEAVPTDHDLGSEAATEFSVPLPALSPGRYVVNWRALSQNDGHVMHGRLMFTVASP